MKKALAILITILVALGVGFAGGVYYASNDGDEIDPVTLAEQVTEISDLTTLQCDYADTGEFKGDAKKILGHDIPFTKKAMKIQYSGVIKMGPKLKDNLTVDVDKSSDKVTITIPHSEILSHEIDEESIQVLYIKNGVFNSVTPENTNKLRKETKAAKEKNIKKSDYLEQADENAVNQITLFLNTVYPDLDVEVKFKTRQ